MIEPTAEMRLAFDEAPAASKDCYCAVCLNHRLAAVLAIVERDQATEVAELRALFDLQWTRSREADAMWRAEDPERRANVWPDLGDLLAWLMARIRTLEGEVAPLRAVLHKLIDPYACHYDHHGDCQEHGTTSARPCPHARAKDLLGWIAP